jgi:outer membrane protein assembly factor BamD (BamD/ComL family)
MISKEEKDLKKIREDFTKSIKLFKSEKLQDAKKSFEKIIKTYKESPYTNIMQVQMRSKVYKEFIDFKLSSKKNEPKTNENILNEALLMLNDGKLDKAESYFNILSEKKFSSPFFYYLLALLNMKRENTEATLDYLKKSFDKDETLKIYAYNESDFESLKDNKEFQAIIS